MARRYRLGEVLDRVNHEILTSRVVERVSDKRVPLLIRRYLQAHIMQGGLITANREVLPRVLLINCSRYFQSS